jgi:hypothetical protein
MNSLLLRFQVFLCMALALAAHAFATDLAANDPEGMAVYHGSGMIMDALLALAVTSALTGQRGRIMGWLMAASIAVNLGGWLLYMAYVSPAYYNGAMWSLTAAQVACLFMSDQFAARVRAFNPFAMLFGVRAQPQ